MVSFRRRGVSIPVGFFQALQHRCTKSHEYIFMLFQSLSGFFRPCNSSFRHAMDGMTLFQSLSGFFRPCNSERAR